MAPKPTDIPAFKPPPNSPSLAAELAAELAESLRPDRVRTPRRPCSARRLRRRAFAGLVAGGTRARGFPWRPDAARRSSLRRRHRWRRDGAAGARGARGGHFVRVRLADGGGEGRRARRRRAAELMAWWPAPVGEARVCVALEKEVTWRFLAGRSSGCRF